MTLAQPSASVPAADAVPDSAARRGAGADHDRREFVSLMTSRVGDTILRKPFEVDGATDLVSLCREMSERSLGDALVRDGDRLGMFTTTNLRDAILLPTPPAELAVRDVASFPVMSLSVDDDLFEAMILMQRHRVHRLAVRDGDKVVGVLAQLDLMGFVANNSFLIAHQVNEATDIDELRRAAEQINGLIRVLHGDGVRIEVIAALTGELNRAIFRRLWTLLAPADLRENSCLIVMGSEGRGEQIIKTDQDNGLILREGFDHDDLPEVTRAFTEALVSFGYPPCPGGIMVSNALWRQPVSGYRRNIGQWLYGDDAEGPMNLAIFLDAVAVAGDGALLDEVKEHLYTLLSDSDAYLARFAAAVNSFAEDRSWWSRLPGLSGRGSAEVDIKKLGLFPIVQGARALALKYRMPQIGTADRLTALADARRIDADLARDLTDALRFLIGVKLDNNLRQMEAGRKPDNLVRLEELGTLDRQALKDSLAIVRRFREWVSQHFRLGT
ncbi:MAG: putative nucleotidyltransferase substrate binding domain-containing protein [Paracoccus sp. (in: a-proteobacteria)]|nr:putative nucleotidyltransferase substrate binding domain-containing protein [Paracoccus sp. (in: a-proteobacteria)]